MTMFQNNWGFLSSLDYDFGDSLFGKDFGLLSVDSSEFFLNPDDNNILRSIHLDCKQIESSGGSLSPSDVSETSEIQETPKYEIRNQDCMWSGSNSNSSTSNNNISKNYRNEQNNLNCEIDLSIIKTECIIENDYKNGNSDSINDYTNVQNPQKVIPKPIQTNMQHIPPGTSLLRFNQQKKHSVNNNNNNNNINKVSIANVMTTDFLKERENITSTARPDTPLSLDDDAPEFKHTVDLSACVMGSNNICLETDEDKIIINNIKEQLEDMSTKNLDIRKIIPVKKNRSLSEVLHVIGNVENANNIINHQNSIIQESDSDSDDGGSNISIIYSPSPTRQQVNYSVTHSDHSYTRSKDGGVDVVGLETPSDSDEEIDVVSIGDKKLPTNPSDKDRRALQTKVAHKISARIVKTANGLKTIPPRRRCSIDTLNHHSIITPTKSSATNSRYTSPISTPYNNGYSTANSVSSLSSSSSTSSSSSITNVKYSSNMRKRNNNSSMLSSKDEYLPPSKRHRTKKQQQRSSASNNHNSSSSSSNRRHYDADETDPDTIEKRNLHNDMERQRRIGLKNLFEALKKQIPSIQDKERAPKVNILREAAKLCEQLTRDEKLLNAQKQQLQLQLQRREGLLKSLKLSTTKNNTVQSGRFLE